jgi:ABC-type multidrug transport system ATPase subunit
LSDLAVEVRGLSKRFGERSALRAVDLEVRGGEAVALYGPNGSGKTTLIRILTSALRPSSGSFRIAGLDPRKDDLEARRKVGALFHQTFLYDELTAEENLLFFARLHGVRDERGRARSLLETVGLADRAADPVGGFSRGMQQRLSLARCLIHDPEIVFLDEPFTGLDPQSAATFVEVLGELRARGRTLLHVSHDLARGLRLSDRFVILNRGRIVEQGASGALEPERFERLYLERAGAAAAAGGRR